MKAAREAWFEGQLDLDPAKLIFIDETGASTKMARLPRRRPTWSLEDDHIYRWVEPQRHGRADGSGRPHER